MARAKQTPKAMTQAELVMELSAILDEEMDAAGGEASRSAILDTFFERHPIVDGEDEAHILSADKWVTKTLSSVVEKRNPDRAGKKLTAQLSLPGYDKVQDTYSVERDGQVIYVRVANLTRTEAMSRVNEFRAMGSSLNEHADQLEAFAEKFLQD